MSETDNDSSGKDEIDQRILDAAEQLFIHYRYDKTTVDDIAREAGVSKSTIYLRWKRKEDLFGALIWRAVRRFTAQWLDMVEADPQGGTFRGMFKNALLATRDNAFVKVIFGGDMRTLGSFINRPELQVPMNAKTEMSTAFMSQFQEAGIIRSDINVAAVSYLMNAMRHGLLNIDVAILNGEMPPIDELMEVLLDMLASYLEPEDGGDSETGKQIIRDVMRQYDAVLTQFENSQLKE
jgi:TetR/AcrR family acrAB operon transcriptional repressor